MSIDFVMLSNHLILCHPLLLLPSVFPSIKVFSNESILCIRWPKYWNFSISPSNDYSGLISFRIDWFDPLAVQGTLKSFLKHHTSKASILQRRDFQASRGNYCITCREGNNGGSRRLPNQREETPPPPPRKAQEVTEIERTPSSRPGHLWACPAQGQVCTARSSTPQCPGLPGAPPCSEALPPHRCARPHWTPGEPQPKAPQIHLHPKSNTPAGLNAA